MKSHARLLTEDVPATFRSVIDSLLNIYKSLSTDHQKQIMGLVQEGRKAMSHQLKGINSKASRGVELVSKEAKKHPGIFIAAAVGLVAGLTFLGYKQQTKSRRLFF